MNSQVKQWWLTRAGSAAEGPFEAAEVVRRVTQSGGPAGWLSCAVGESTWKDLLTEPELLGLFPPPAVAPPPVVPPPVPGAVPPASPAAAQAPHMAYAPAATPPASANVGGLKAASPHQGLIILLHLSQLAGYIIPMLGWILPLVLWLTNRDKPDVDRHGKEVVNFMIIVVPAIIISALLMFVLIGFLLLPIVLVGQVVCVILAVVKASNNEFFSYPVPFRVIH